MPGPSSAPQRNVESSQEVVPVTSGLPVVPAVNSDVLETLAISQRNGVSPGSLTPPSIPQARATEVREQPEANPINNPGTTSPSSPSLLSREGVYALLNEAVAKGYLNAETVRLAIHKHENGIDGAERNRSPWGRLDLGQLSWLANTARELFQKGLQDSAQRIWELMVDGGKGLAHVEQRVADNSIMSSNFFEQIRPRPWEGFVAQLAELSTALQNTWFFREGRNRAEYAIDRQSRASGYTPIVASTSPSLRTPATSNSTSFAQLLAADPNRRDFRNVHAGAPTVVIDPGHGGDDPGAVANGLREETLTRKQSLYIAERLLELGINVYILRRNQSDDLSISQRNALIEQYGDVGISVHFNSASSQANGIEVFYADNQDRALAEAINASWSATGQRNRGVKYHTQTAVGGLGVLRGNQRPAVLVEGGFISNPEEARLLADDNFLRRQGHLIADGIARYLGRGTRTVTV